MDASAFEKFQERMKKASQQIKAIRKQEKKQKKKETELVQILLKFIKTSHKKTLVTLLSRVIAQNVPANFVLSIAILGNKDIQKEVGAFLLPENISEQDLEKAEKAEEQARIDGTESQSKALIFFGDDKSMPLKVRIEIDQWIKGLLLQASESPHKLLKTAYDVREEKVKDEDSQFGDYKKVKLKTESASLIKLIAHVMHDYMETHGVEAEYEKIEDFSRFLLKGILKRTEEDLDNRVELEGGGE